MAVQNPRQHGTPDAGTQREHGRSDTGRPAEPMPVWGASSVSWKGKIDYIGKVTLISSLISDQGFSGHRLDRCHMMNTTIKWDIIISWLMLKLKSSLSTLL